MVFSIPGGSNFFFYLPANDISTYLRASKTHLTGLCERVAREIQSSLEVNVACSECALSCVQAGEFWSKVNKSIFVSATPGKFELELSTLGAGKSGGLGWDEIGGLVDAQAVIRPTGITDPPVDIRPSEGQVSDMVQECQTRGARGERVLVTALTKQMAGNKRRERLRL